LTEKNYITRDEALERSPQYRFLISQENADRKRLEKKKHQHGGKKIGEKLPDGTYVEVSTSDCDWHERWHNPEFDSKVKEAKANKPKKYTVEFDNKKSSSYTS
jgi:hypothetical protein